jgi:hypothetical protein
MTKRGAPDGGVLRAVSACLSLPSLQQVFAGSAKYHHISPVNRGSSDLHRGLRGDYTACILCCRPRWSFPRATTWASSRPVQKAVRA